MYLSHYGLQKKPFDISPDPSFLWLGEKHREALSYLKYGIMENKGFLMITGDVGTGKTALLRCLTQQIDAANFVVAVSDPDMNRLDFFNFLADSLQMNRTFKSKGEFLIHFKRFLREAYSEERKVLLIIDESQRLNHDLLQEIRLLSNIDLGGQVMLNIFFVGQTEFIQLLREERNRTVRQRIAASFHLDPLEADEVKKYIAHRLHCAGAANQIFTDEAIQRVFKYTTGYPRLINILCDHALMTGYASGATAVLPSMVDECVSDLPITFGNRVTPAIAKVELQAEPQPAPSPVPALESASLAVPPEKSKSTVEVMKAATAKQMAMMSAESQKSLLRPLALAFAALLMLAGAIYFSYGPIRGLFTASSQAEMDPSSLSSLKSEGKNEIFTQSSEAIKGQNALAAYNSATTEVPANYTANGVKTVAWTNNVQASSEPRNQSLSKDSQTAAPSGGGQALAGEVRSAIIYFNYNSYLLPREARAELVRLADTVLQYPETEISITGYTDSRGNNRTNHELSQTRAEIVRDFFIARGVLPENIEAIGSGAQNPIGNNSTRIGRRQNRRVEIELRRPSTG